MIINEKIIKLHFTYYYLTFLNQKSRIKRILNLANNFAEQYCERKDALQVVLYRYALFLECKFF